MNAGPERVKLTRPIPSDPESTVAIPKPNYNPPFNITRASHVVMTVRDDMLNGHDICHGGLVTTLADSAFAFACNAYNEVTVASGFDVNLVAAARLGDRLTATAHELSKAGRTGVYDIHVANQRGEAVAAFRGRSYTAKGKAVVEGLPVGKAK